MRETRTIIREKIRWELSSTIIGRYGVDPRCRILGCTRNAIIPSPSGFGFMNINARLICIMSSYCSGIETSERERVIPVRVSARDSASAKIFEAKLSFNSRDYNGCVGSHRYL